MLHDTIEDARLTAIEAAIAAGDIARSRFGKVVQSRIKGESGDVVTEVDHLAESAIVTAIRNRFPGHSVEAEEGGLSGDSDEWLWVVDPLDGTNNYVLGLPLYGVQIALCHRGGTMVGVVHDSALNQTRWAVRGGGAWLDGRRLAVSSPVNLRHATLSWYQGYGIGGDRRARRCRRSLERVCKRVLTTWSPSIDWGMFASNRLGGVVSFHNAGHDFRAGALIAVEAGAVAVDFAGHAVDLDREPGEVILAAEGAAATIAAALTEGLDGGGMAGARAAGS